MAPADLDKVVAAMLGALGGYLPPPNPPLPDPTLAVASMTERLVGLGKLRGTGSSGPLGVIALKGIRLDSVARFQLWAPGPSEAEKALSNLNSRLLADRDKLRANGFLRVGLQAAPPAEPIPPVNGWRKYAEYQILYEFAYQDTDEADSLIAKIPISIDSGFGESVTVTDEMTRWDNPRPAPPPPLPGSAPPLVVRGPFGVGSMSTLAFVPGAAPTGTVTLTRTFDGATGLPASYPTLAAFLAAVAGPKPQQSHAKVTFPSLTSFLAAFSVAGDPVTMGDWDANGVPDTYASLALALNPAIVLPEIIDRFEITYQHPAFDNVAVIYLRATRDSGP